MIRMKREEGQEAESNKRPVKGRGKIAENEENGTNESDKR